MFMSPRLLEVLKWIFTRPDNQSLKENEKPFEYIEEMGMIKLKENGYPRAFVWKEFWSGSLLPLSPQARSFCGLLPQEHLSTKNRCNEINEGIVSISVLKLLQIPKCNRNRNQNQFANMKSLHFYTRFDISSAISSAIPVPAWNNDINR